MKIRIFSLILSLASILALPACGAKPATAPEALSTGELMSLAAGNQSGYMGSITGDATKDREIWARAETLYQEFKQHQAAALAMPTRTIKEVKENASEFTYQLTIKMHQQNPQHMIRTLKSLKNFEPIENMEYTIYGGWKNEAMKQEATGHFYTKKINGRWWFIDPLGYPYISVATDSMGYSYGNTAQKDAAVKKYGSLEKWAIAAVRESKDDLGFTSTVKWREGHDELRNVQDTVAYSVLLSLVGSYEASIGAKDPTPSGSTLLLYGMHVFDPEFVTSCESRIKSASSVIPLNDPYFMGFFLDNEIPTKEDMLGEFLTLDIKTMDINYYSYAAAWTFLAHETGKSNPTLADAKNSALQDLFRGFVYDRLYAVAVPFFRQYAPDALVLGNRALSAQRRSEWITRMVGYWSDVISHNWYHQITPFAEQLNQMSLWADKPMMVTEWYVASEESEGNFSTATSSVVALVKTQKDRGLQYQNYTLRLLECQNVIGWTWWRYIDRNDQKNNNCGLYSSNHNLYKEFAGYAAEINKNAYALALYFDQK